MRDGSAQIVLNNIVKKYGERTILDSVNMEIYPGEFVCIFGKSGGGKSTLLNIIGTLDTYDQGTLSCFSIKDPIKSEKKSEMLRREKVAYLFQNFALVERMTVEENMRMAAKYSKDSGGDEVIKAALERMGVECKLKSKVFELSGGEQQRVALARNMVKPYEIMLADEPTGSLDAENKAVVMSALEELNRKGKTIVVVSHDKDFINVAKKVYYISGGKLEKAES